jgi:hypothetical protein
MAVAALTLTGGAGCYSTQGLPLPALGSLRRSDQSREVLLEAGQQGRLRIRPASLVRFRRIDGATTAWTQASNVRLTPDLVVIGWGPEPPQVLRWEHVDGIEVNDLDMGMTLMGVVGGASLVMVAAATEMVILAALESCHVRVDQVGLTRAALDGVVSAAGRHLEEDPAAPRVRADESDAPPEAVLAARPLFSAQARRRDLVRATLGVDSGVEAGGPVLRPQVGVFASLRLLNVLELGAGINMVDVRAPTFESLPALEAPLVDRVRVSGRGRIALHMDLDQRRRVALMLGQEVGFSSGGWADLRTVWGMRFRLRDAWQLGVLPFNPRVTWSRGDALSQTAYASSLELAWVF